MSSSHALPTLLGRAGGADPPPHLVAGCENPKPCQSELIVLEHGSYSGDPVTKVLLQPLTGGRWGPGQHGGVLRWAVEVLEWGLCLEPQAVVAAWCHKNNKA